MEKRIYKYPITDPSKIAIEMPEDAEILTVQMQNGTPCIWALVNPDNKTKERYFEVFGTGHPVYCDMGIDRKYINTFQMNGNLVFHLFERIN